MRYRQCLCKVSFRSYFKIISISLKVVGDVDFVYYLFYEFFGFMFLAVFKILNLFDIDG